MFPQFFVHLHVKKEFESLFMFLSHPKLLRTRNLFGSSVYMLNSPEKQSTKSFVFSVKFRKKMRLDNEEQRKTIDAQCSDKIYEDQEGETLEE